MEFNSKRIGMSKVLIMIMVGLPLAACSNAMKAPSELHNASAAGTNGSNGGTGGNHPLPDFRAGDSFDKSKLPFAPTGRLIQDADNYPYLSDFKAIAIAEDGSGLAAGGAKFSSQAEVSRVVLQQCQLSGKKCAIFAEGNTIKYDAGVFTAALKAADSGARPYDGSMIPTILSGTGYFQNMYYTVGQDAFKAFAFGAFGRAGHGTGATQAEAERRALQACEGIDGTPCVIYARGNDVVWNVTNFTFNPTAQISYGPAAFNPGNIPFVRSVDRTNIINVKNGVGAGQTYALALSRYGHYYGGVAAGAAQAQAIALQQCNAQVGASDYSCFIYSVGDSVVMTKADLQQHNSAASVWGQ